MCRSGGTCQHDVGAPLMPFNTLTGHRPSRKAYHEQKWNSWLAMASESRRATDACAVAPLVIGMRTIPLSPYRAGVAGPCPTRLLASPAFPACSCSLAFRHQVRWVASKSSALNFGPLRGQFSPCVPWRTLSPHPALQRAAFRRWDYAQHCHPFSFDTTLNFMNVSVFNRRA
jgi:hypothetical protein